MKVEPIFVIVLIVVSLGFAVFVSGLQPKKPEFDMNEDIPTPTIHEPKEEWIVNHPHLVEEEGRYQCLLCHDPMETCDNCHSFVGIKTHEIFQ